MTMLTALALLSVVAFGLSLFVFDYLFNRFMGREDTNYLAAVMHEIHSTDAAAVPPRAKVKSASAA
jgi:hypothetical protein